ncbi:MAG: TRAP transporter large permease subunit, partial [Bauldia sp.]
VVLLPFHEAQAYFNLEDEATAIEVYLDKADRVGELQPAIGEALGISKDFVMVWFGAVVAVTLQTAYLSPPVAMSAYYLKQVVKDWSLATIYKGMFEFMILQCIAIVLIVVFPWIATSFPEQVRREQAGIKVEQIDDTKNRLEDDPFEGMKERPRTGN